MSRKLEIKPYHEAAGGWGATAATFEHLIEQGILAKGTVELWRMNKPGADRTLRHLKVLPWNMPDGCCGTYYPEANVLIPLYARDPISGIPSSKAFPATLRRSTRQPGTAQS